MNLRTIQGAYKLLMKPHDAYNNSIINFHESNPYAYRWTFLHKYKSISGDIYFDWDDVSTSRHGTPDNIRFPDSLRHAIRESVRNYRESISSVKEEKARLVRNLTAFDSAANNKPIFFATIYSTYKGDIKAYVDDLYKKSIMGNKWRLNTFLRWPSAKKLQKDMSVQFAIGLALYELWIKDVREGKIADEPSDDRHDQTPHQQQNDTTHTFAPN